MGRLLRRRGAIGLVLVLPATLMAIGLFFVPLGLMIWMSLNKWPLVGTHVFVGISNYRAAANDGMFGQSLLFSLEFTAVVVVGLVVIGGGLATLVAARRRGVGVLRTAYFLPVVVGTASASYLWLWMLNPSVGLLDRMIQQVGMGKSTVQWFGSTGLAFVAVSIMTLWKLAGFSMLILMSGLQVIPAEVVEAARIDGAGRIRQWASVKIPLLRRHIALVVVFGVAGSFLAFDQFYIMTNGAPGSSTVTAVYDIYNTSFVNFNLGYGSALAVIVMAVLLLFSIVQLALVRGSADYS